MCYSASFLYLLTTFCRSDGVEEEDGLIIRMGRRRWRWRRFTDSLAINILANDKSATVIAQRHPDTLQKRVRWKVKPLTSGLNGGDGQHPVC